jgi:hypothetical protein
MAQVEALVALTTVAAGWLVFADQLRSDGWIAGGGTGWLLAAAVLATSGAAIAVTARRSGHHAWTATGLALVALSPTVFAYVLNLAVIVLAVYEVLIAVRHHSSEPTPAH